MEDFAVLDRQREDLERTMALSRRRVDSYNSAVKLLEHLMRTTSFNDEFARMEYPAKLLKGPLSLTSAAQKEAVSELAVTLDRDARVSVSQKKLLRALQMFYAEYFDEAGRPPVENAEAEAGLRQFLDDPGRGARNDYLEYRRYGEALAEADREPAKLSGLPSVRPEFYPDMHIRWIAESRSLQMKRHLVVNTPWNARHKAVLERVFSMESDPGLLAACLAAMRNIGGADESFLDAQMENEAKGLVVTDYLREFETPALREMLRSSVRGGFHHLFSVLTHLVGFDPNYFYFSLKENRLSPEIFSKILDSLFLAFSPQESYGMDLQYAENILEKQRTIPQNVLRLLQKVMPRGIDTAPMESFFEFLRGFNDEYRRLAGERACYEDGRRLKDHAYMQLMVRLSAVEAIRFVVFTYIYDRICLCLKTFKKLEPDGDRLFALFAEQLDFEAACGGNANIKAYIWDLQARLAESPRGGGAA